MVPHNNRRSFSTGGILPSKQRQHQSQDTLAIEPNDSYESAEVTQIDKCLGFVQSEEMLYKAEMTTRGYAKLREALEIAEIRRYSHMTESAYSSFNETPRSGQSDHLSNPHKNRSCS